MNSNTELRKSVEDYIEDHYDTDYITCVYINGGGGSWIKAVTDHIIKSKAVIDRLHLMNYVYRISRRTKESKDETVALSIFSVSILKELERKNAREVCCCSCGYS